MQSLRDLKKRIRSVGNIEQITKAMEVVSMNKMRRSQSFAIAARPFAVASLELVENLLKMTPELPALLTVRPINRKLLVVVTTDKGLVGAFNENALRLAEKWIAEEDKAGRAYALVAVGKKAKDYFERKKIPLTASFSKFGDYTQLTETSPIAQLVIEGFLSGSWDSVEFIYMHFRSTLRQEIALRKVLPATEIGLKDVITGILPEHGKFSELSPDHEAKSRFNYEYVFEPSPLQILNTIVPNLFTVQVHHIILESNASEHSARMVSMKNASENASELVSELTLSYNKARQAGITAELSEIIAGQESVGS